MLADNNTVTAFNSCHEQQLCTAVPQIRSLSGDGVDDPYECVSDDDDDDDDIVFGQSEEQSGQ